jgi:hypothetical protein
MDRRQPDSGQKYEEKCSRNYSIFDSALYRRLNVEWLFSQEKATLQDLPMATRESEML